MILIVKLDENMPPLMVEALKHNILAAPGVRGVEWQAAAQPSAQMDDESLRYLQETLTPRQLSALRDLFTSSSSS